MSYQPAIAKAWDSLSDAGARGKLEVAFLGDAYEVDPGKRSVFSLACNVPAKDYVLILLLHYLAAFTKGPVAPQGAWVSFKELGGESYYPAFRKRAIEPIIRKYGSNPSGLLESAGRLKGSSLPGADAGVVIEALSGVPVLINLWKGDEEFGPEANMLFDRSIGEIFCTEDIAVLAGAVSARL
ncbi:MAG: DUF3786 domain-containing protein [Candidatus Omnitrophica bacterium]|nr:DUF3786 domain-containing protein [Candidatus Omnitrophota bacterium]